MNTNDFYKELMSEYSFDYEKIRKAKKKRRATRFSGVRHFLRKKSCKKPHSVL